MGYKPTFYSKGILKPTVEVHLFHFNMDIYDQPVKVEWHKFIRKEQKFNGIHELVSQIQQDKETAVEYFNNLKGECKNIDG